MNRIFSLLVLLLSFESYSQCLGLQTGAYPALGGLTPAPTIVNGVPTYLPNTQVTVCYTLQSFNQTGGNWLEGVRFVTKQFKDVLTTAGIEEIDALGKLFDHNTMEAMQEEITSIVEQTGLVAKVVAPGYKLKGRLLLPARVVVYKSE